MKFSKVFAINPPSPPGYVSNKDSMGGFGQLFPEGATRFPPLDLMYLGTHLVTRGYPAELLECLALEFDREALLDRVAPKPGVPEGPVFIVVRTSAPTLDWDLSICGEIKQRRPDCRIAVYGPVVAEVIPRIKKEAAIDYIISGDPEDVVDELLANPDPVPGLRLLDAGGDNQPRPGLTFRTGGGWSENSARIFEKDLDSMPFPKWELVPYRKYRLPRSSAKSDVPFLPMQTSRGCPIGCHYCPYPVGQGLPWRHRSATNVVDEIEHLVRDLGIRYILFRDPMFSLNQKRVVEICDQIQARNLKFEWRCETRIDFLVESTLQAMAAAGCEGINFGVESSDVTIQKGVGRKPIAPEKVVECIRLCHRLGIKTFAFFIIGLPGDTLETILATIYFAIRLQPTWVQFTAASPFIGTRLRTWAVERGLVTDDEYAYVNSHDVSMGNGVLSKEQVQSLYRFARFVQNYLLNRKGLLKRDGRGLPYRAAKSMADTAASMAAGAAFAVARRWYSMAPARV